MTHGHNMRGFRVETSLPTNSLLEQKQRNEEPHKLWYIARYHQNNG